jgi:hypothetical protein
VDTPIEEYFTAVRCHPRNFCTNDSAERLAITNGRGT